MHPEKVWLIGRHLTPKRMKRARAMFKRHGAKAVFFGRFLFGVRAVTFFVSGSMRVPLTTFLIMDGLAALLSVPISIFLAWYFGAHLESAFKWIGTLNQAILVAVLVAIVVILTVLWRRRRHLPFFGDEDEDEDEDEETQQPTDGAASPTSAATESARPLGPQPL
jgi:membrane protein DedA with SNARE-associated domain